MTNPAFAISIVLTAAVWGLLFVPGLSQNKLRKENRFRVADIGMLIATGSLLAANVFFIWHAESHFDLYGQLLVASLSAAMVIIVLRLFGVDFTWGALGTVLFVLMCATIAIAYFRALIENSLTL